MSIKLIEVILKTAARCNINCNYCYYFYGADDKWQERPKKISLSLIESTTRFLLQAIQDFQVKSVQIDFHGGEPLLQGKKQFDQTCAIIKKALEPHSKLTLALQTNAILIDEEWINLFRKHNVAVSVSLDGPREINDIYRVNHRGAGTHDRVVDGILALQEAVKNNLISPIALLCVINPKQSGKIIYRYFVDKLKITSMDFLLPSNDYDSLGKINIQEIGDFLLDVFWEWTKDDNPQINIRLFRAFFAKLQGVNSFLFPTNKPSLRENFAFTIDTDGSLAGDDSLRANSSWLYYPKMNIVNTTFPKFWETELQWQNKNIVQPDDCNSCLWLNVCHGGQIENRYSSQNGYNNPSVYCEALKKLYGELSRYLIKNGMSTDQLSKVLAA